ncbi:MAG TPA: MFS transporter [Solirubrobacteraceae bacterium]|jgi:predicted MFS family arabinose efflux permease
MEPRGALSVPAFRALWAAGLISDIGDWLLLIALPIVVYQLTGSALGTSLAFAAELGPGIVLAPLGGRLADGIDRRALLIAVSALQALALLPLLLVHGRDGLVIVYTVIVVQASLAAVFDPAKNALLPTLVKPPQLVSANSMVGLGSAVGRLAGGPLGGLLLAAGSLETIVIADAVTFAVAALLIARVPATRPPQGGSADRADVSARREDRPARPLSPGGLRAVLRHPAVAAALLVALVADVAQGIFVVLFIVFVARRLHGGSAEIGLLRGVQAIGAIGGGVLLAVRGDRWRPVFLVAAAATAFGLLDLTIWNAPGATRSVAVYAALFALAGAPGVILETGGISFLQAAVSDRERGRVFAAVGLTENAGQALGIVAAGLLTAPLGLMALLNAQGALYLAAGGLVLVLARRRTGSRQVRAPACGWPSQDPRR